MRVDYLLAGDHSETKAFLSKVLFEPYWGGSRTKLIDTFEYGDYKIEIRDVLSGELIYSRGFCSIFREWQTTPEALQVEKAFANTARFPYPLNPVHFELFLRAKDQSLHSIFKMEIDPANKQIERNPPFRFKTKDILNNGDPGNKVDIAILAEGYTSGEMKKFRRDAQRLMDYFFSVEPFRSNKESFNVRLVLSNSKNSGTDFPHEDIWKETILNSHFNTFGIERYLTSSDYWNISDVASLVPCDQIIILVNTENYGGGGIFNFYSLTGSDHTASPGVLVHEFGHAFAGLGDEYYTSDVSYEGFYDLNYEPWEPNLTTLQNFSIKWEEMIDPGIPVPTPPEKKYHQSTGVFEGAGYVSKGIYRPGYDCLMKSNSRPEFCRVCQHAIERMIRFYAD